MKICVVQNVRIEQRYHAEAVATLESYCRAALDPQTELHMRVPKRGPHSSPDNMEDHMNFYYAHLIRNEVIETIIEADSEGFDAIVVNCFDDPGVKEARSFAKTPVFGLLEPTLHLACQLGWKLGALVPDMPGHIALVQKQINELGLSDRFIINGVRTEDKAFVDSFAEALENPQAMVDRLKQKSMQLVADGAEVIVLACGGLGQIAGVARFHSFLYRNLQIPVINPLVAALKTAEMLIPMRRALGIPIPSQASVSTRFTPVYLERIRKEFSIT